MVADRGISRRTGLAYGGAQRIVTRWPRASPLLGYGIEAPCQGAMTGTFDLAIEGRVE